MKTCTKCKAEKRLDEFHCYISTERGFRVRDYCKECFRKCVHTQRKYQKYNPAIFQRSKLIKANKKYCELINNVQTF